MRNSGPRAARPPARLFVRPLGRNTPWTEWRNCTRGPRAVNAPFGALAARSIAPRPVPNGRTEANSARRSSTGPLGLQPGSSAGGGDGLAAGIDRSDEPRFDRLVE